MRCPQCQHENPFGATFCNSCGARLELVCPACKHTNVAGSRFCNSCGRAIGDTTSAVSPSRFTSPETYTPKHLAEKILTSKSALEGERKQVTVLFADMKGSMELLADRDLWQRQGKKTETTQLLAEVYGWFTEGFDTADLRNAKALLQELS